ncbi:MAG: CPBP family intramembrane metalloprotease [Proteobacteria bacterium]|nr:CPBP family intramembrane metalloprotease [Pseudomonadota bacterium]
MLALILMVPIPSIGVLAGLAIDNSVLGVSVWIAGKAWLLALPAVWLALVDRKPLVCSLPRRGLVVGALSGMAVATIIVGAYALVGTLWIDPAKLIGVLEPVGLTNKMVYLGAAAYWILFNSVLEEYVYRWFVFTQAKTLWGARWAAVVSALAFVIHHGVVLAIYFDWRVTLLCCIGICLGGLFWSALYHKYQNIWAPYISHAVVDIAVFAIGWLLLFGWTW